MHTLRLWAVLIAASAFLTAFATTTAGAGFGFTPGSIHMLDTGGGGPTK
jgi:hypothetical protein